MKHSRVQQQKGYAISGVVLLRRLFSLRCSLELDLKTQMGARQVISAVA